MEFIDLAAQQRQIRGHVDQRIARVLDHGRYILGPEINELEQRLADYAGVAHCISCSSGTDALVLAYLALDVGAGSEVLTSPFSFIAAAEAAALIGAVPRYSDIRGDDYNIDPQGIRAAITERTGVIVPVDLFGQCADYEQICALAETRGIPVIEDAAQSFGARRNGTRACAFGDIAITSFFPAKPLGCYGDGGACFTNDDALAERLRMLRVHGQGAQYRHDWLGINGRMDTLQAAILLAKLEVFDAELAERDRIAARYSQALGDRFRVPGVASGNSSAWAQYTIEVDDRDAVRKKLQDDAIPTAVYYPIPLHRQTAVADPDAHCPVAEAAAERVMSLPFSPWLAEADQDRVIKALLG